MSEPKLISPMLDSFDMGGPISDHDGVRCCPAMRKNSEDKYIVKIISVPASQTKLDALLLTGAYPNKEAALNYFKELADGIVDEKKILDNLAQLEGFAAYEDCQIVPMEDATGYDVYLLSPYRMTLERSMNKKPLTQLDAVNLGLDLCAALAICRRSGYLCVDIKPSNIVLTGDKEFRIADLGFIRLNSLQYASLPDKYRSKFTAPEVEDAFSAMSDTIDIYAVGMVLYQIYNDGMLPSFDGETLPVPQFADEEISQIILKAVNPNPAERWQDPVEMGQALVSYMQKNGVNDTPLTSEYFGCVSEPECQDPPSSDEDIENIMEEVSKDVSEVNSEDIADVTALDETAEPADIPLSAIEAYVDEEPVTEVTSEDEITQVSVFDEAYLQETQDEDNTTTDEDVPAMETGEETYDNLSFLSNDEEDALEVDYDAVSDDVSEMLEYIDELAAHELPEPPVAPDPIEVKLPEPEEPEVTEEIANGLIESEIDEIAEEFGNYDDDDFAEDAAPEETPYVPKKKRTGLILCIVLLLLIALGIGGYVFYQEYYLQPIHSLTLTGTEDRLQVQLTAEIDESYLTVVCADAHGNKLPAPVVGGTAVFSGLAPDTAYTVSVEVEGFHKLTGITSKVYSTPVQTKVVQINTITGSESGSVILSFAIEGPDSDQWNVIYNADGEAERVTAFPAHMVTLTGLTVGKEYTFRIEPVEDIFLSGVAETTYVVKELICAENLHVTACANSALTAEWTTPEGSEVAQWSVRCYNGSGYDETITTAENSVTFEGIDDTSGYTVEVTAEFMSVNQRVTVSPNSITVSEFAVDASDSSGLKLSWNANRDVPTEGWTLRYSINGINAAQQINTTENSAVVPAISGGSYVFSLFDGSGNAVLGGPFVHTQAEATSFAGFGTSASALTLRLCKTPSAASWSYLDLEDDDYVNSFAVGQKISAVLALSGETSDSNDSVMITYAVYNENGDLVNFSHDSQTWRSMWYQNYCELDVSGIPTEVGTYNLVLYFNGMIAGSQKFAITT